MRLRVLFLLGQNLGADPDKTEILPIGSEKYRKLVIEKRQTSESEKDKISEEIWIVKDGKTLRTLGSYMGNKTNQVT